MFPYTELVLGLTELDRCLALVGSGGAGVIDPQAGRWPTGVEGRAWKTGVVDL